MGPWLSGGREQKQRLERLEGEIQRLQAKSAAEEKGAREATFALEAASHRLSGLAETIEALALANTNQASALKLAAVELERLRDLPAAMLELEARLAELEVLAGPKAIRSGEERAKGYDEALTKIRMAVRRAELQLDIFAEESRKTGAALFERIETLRIGGRAEPPHSESE